MLAKILTPSPCVKTLCGKGGIRTPGTLQYGGFQDRCNRPLYHLSKSVAFLKAMQRYNIF